MHIDAAILDNNNAIECDICIIGAGPAGISMALQWINAKETVILLEGGGFEYEAAMQELYKGKSTGLPYYSLESSRLHYFGGTSGHWAGYCSPLDGIDFSKRSWVQHSGWPITLTDLAAYYEKAQQLLELGPFKYTLEYWRKNNPRLQALPFDDQFIRNKVWQFSPPTRFGIKYRNIIVNAPNIHLYTHATVSEIITNEHGTSVVQLTVKNLQGKEHRVKARKFIFACCAIQNARLLLASNKQVSSGIGNSHGLVGRYFMEHPEIPTADLFLKDAHPTALYKLQFFYTKMRAELTIHPQKQEVFGLLNASVALNHLIDDTSAEVADSSGGAADENLKGWEIAERYFKEGKIPEDPPSAHKRFEFVTRLEQAPNPNSRIRLDTEKDALGVPRVILHWQLSAMEKKTARKMQQLIGEQAGIAGVGRVRMKPWLADKNDAIWPSFIPGAWHHMGTTRMHDDPKQGVVDKNCKVHGIANLYVAGSSCFTTSGCANPTLTLVALSLRLAAHIQSIMK